MTTSLRTPLSPTSLRALRRAVAAEAGPDAAARALQQAGMAAGDALFDRLFEDAEEPRSMSLPEFCDALSDALEREGLGRLEPEELHEGIGTFVSESWAEAEPDTEGRPTCFFTAGLLAALLGRVADGEVAVLEVECRSRGDARCRFAFGAEDTLTTVHGALSGGASLDEAVERLG